jgi:acyl carrier protein phosphodiesterase
MNYLAHAYLSFGLPEITVGGLISDFVKGKKKFDYPDKIQQGISLHRAIDTFTDTHAITQKAKSFFREAYGLYSGPITDVIYDYFVANDPLLWPAGERQLNDFALKTYDRVGGLQSWLPDRFARMFHYMHTQNWLYNYRFKEGLFNSLSGLSRRASYMGDAGPACRIFEEQYSGLQNCYEAFFPELKDFALRTLEHLQDNGSGKIE